MVQQEDLQDPEAIGPIAPSGIAGLAAQTAPAADLSTLLAELGGDNLRNRVIAEGLQKQGVDSLKDIGVQQTTQTQYQPPIEDVSPGGYQEVPVTQFVNKTTGEQIDPSRVGIIQNGQGGVSGGDIFFNMNADDSGNVSFDPQWSPRAHGFLRDNPVGQAIMALGSVIPSPLQPFIAGAGAADSALHGNYGAALAKLLPVGLNQVAGSELLGQLAGNPDFDPSAITSSGQIAEALGVPSKYADIVGKVGASELSNTLKGGPLGMGALNAAVGEGVKSGLGALGGIANSFLPGASFGNLSEDELNSLYGSQSPTGPGSVSPDLSLYSPDQLNQLYNIENPGAYDAQALSAIADPDALRYGDIFGNMSGDEINNLYGSQVPPTAPINPLNTVNINAKSELPVSGIAPELYSPARLEQLNKIENPPIGPNPLPPVTVSATRPVVNSGVAPELYSPARLEQLNSIENPPVVTTPTPAPAPATTTPAKTAELPKVEVSAKAEKPDSGVSPVTALTTPTTSTAPTAPTTTPAKTTSAPAAITSSQIASMAAGAIAPAIVAAITGGGGSSTPTTKATTTTQTPAAPATETSAPTTLEAQGMQALPDSQNRYWRQTGAQGTGGKGGVRFFDWYDTPENRTMAPTNTPAVAPEQVAASAAPTAKQYFNAATNRYYTDPTGKWQPPAGWTQTTFKDGGDVKTNFDNGGFLSGDVNLYGDAPTGILDSDINNYLASLPSDNASYGGGPDLTQTYQQEIKDAAAASGVGSGGASSALKSLLQLAKDNPNLTKALLAGGLGATLGYAGRPKPIAPMGMQGGSLGLTQAQVHGALKGIPVKRAGGGEIGGYAGGGGLHYLKSAEDGMADRIPATIDNKQPAKLSGGEFVIPADVVSHLGNGNSEAGAKQLYAMMDRIRHARTGTKKQGKQINPAKFTPK